MYVGDKKVFNTSHNESRRRASQGACSLITPDETEHQMVTFTERKVPLPAKCSAQLQRLLQEHSVNMPPPMILESTMDQLNQLSQSEKDCSIDDSELENEGLESCGPRVMSKALSIQANSYGSENIPIFNRASSIPPHANNDTRPIYPHLPYSPYGSPATSPRVRRKPLRETTRVNSINSETGEFVQLNQYKVEGAIGQVPIFSGLLLDYRKLYI